MYDLILAEDIFYRNNIVFTTFYFNLGRHGAVHRTSHWYTRKRRLLICQKLAAGVPKYNSK